MKSLRLFLCLLLLPTLPRVHAGEPDIAVTEQIRHFYQYYLHALNVEGGDPLFKNRTELKKYASARMLKEIDKASKVEGGIEADPFICAQDFGKDWEKNIAIRKVNVGADGRATGEVHLSGKEMKHALKLVLVQEGGVYKIDRVESLNP